MRPYRGPPQPARPLVSRPRLLTLLGDRFERRLVVVVAGAGFGKSTLLAQAVAENRLDPRGVDVWVGCTPDDGAASELAAGLLAALDADADEAAHPLTAICAEVWQRAPAEVALILDDVHLVPAESPGAMLLGELVRALPANAHLVLAGRGEPPVAWSRLAATGEVREVQEAELGFTDEELDEFARLRDVPPPLLGGVGGWPALAELTAATGHSRVADFLWEEVLAPLSGQDRRLLAAIAAAGGADDEVAGALAGHSVALSAVLAGLPLITRGEGGWHRLHALWQPALARELSPAEVVQARRTAGRLLHERGDFAAAARLYADAAAWDDLDRLIVDGCQSTHYVVGMDVLGEWLRRLPPERRGQPTAWLLEGSLVQATDPTAAEVLLARAADGCRAAGDLAGEIAALSHLITTAWWQQETIAHLLPRVALVTSAPVDGRAGDSLAALSLHARFVAADVEGDLAGAISALESATLSRFSAEWQGSFETVLGLLHLVLGDAAAALDLEERALTRVAVTARQGAGSIALISLLVLGRQDEVLQQLPGLFTDTLMDERNVAANTVATCVLAWAGEPARAARHLRQAENIGRSLGAPITEVFVTAARLALALATHDESTTALAAHLRGLCDGQPSATGGSVGGGSVARLVDQWFLAVQYVLLPSSRDQWEARPLHGCFAVARDLARAVLTLRRGGALDRSQLPAIGVARAFLPPDWIAELVAAGGYQADPAMTGSRARDMRVQIRLLGPTQVIRGDVPVVHPHLRRARVRELLAYLVVHRGATRQSIAAELWPDLDETSAARNLRVTLTYLAQLLEPEHATRTSSQLLRRDGDRIELIEGPLLTTDVWTMGRLLDDAAHAERQRAPSVALARYQEALGYYTGELLGDQQDPEWLLPHRDRLKRRFVAAAVRAGELLLADGALDEPLQLAQRAVATEWWSEPAHQLLVSSHVAAGNVTAARLALDDCQRMLHELGAPPDTRTVMLARRLGRAAPVKRAPPPGTPSRRIAASDSGGASAPR